VELLLHIIYTEWFQRTREKIPLTAYFPSER